MWKPRTLLILVVCLAIIGALALALPRASEPSYKGHSLSYWLKVADANDEAVIAVNAIGTNAIPLLLRWLTYDPPLWRKNLARTAYNFNPDEEMFGLFYGTERDKARLGFALLGTNAAPALPALITIMQDTNNPTHASRAIQVLGFLGQPALPYLTDALSETNVMHRLLAVGSMSETILHGVPTNACLTLLSKATTDTDLIVRLRATNAILSIAPQALTNAPPH